MMRLNKFITDSGYCSRREADAYIAQGRVTVNGVDATLGSMVDDGDEVLVDGERVGHKAKRNVYMILNKPVGVTCTTDLADKTNIIDFVGYKERIFPVGRLDKDSEGLIILTNNGDIVNRILRAGNNNPKEYIVSVDRPFTDEFLRDMGNGVRILGVTTKPCRIIRRNANTFTIFLTQGLNRQIRRMCQALGYKVVALKRVRVMNLTLGTLETGRWRYLTQTEVSEMMSILATSSGTEEASDERSARPASSRNKSSRTGASHSSHSGAARSSRSGVQRSESSRTQGGSRSQTSHSGALGGGGQSRSKSAAQTGSKSSFASKSKPSVPAGGKSPHSGIPASGGKPTRSGASASGGKQTRSGVLTSKPSRPDAPVAPANKASKPSDPTRSRSSRSDSGGSKAKSSGSYSDYRKQGRTRNKR